jgi:hypothetical protein
MGGGARVSNLMRWLLCVAIWIVIFASVWVIDYLNNGHVWW